MARGGREKRCVPRSQQSARIRGTEVVDLVEAEAARHDRFTWALGKIWIVAKGLPPDVVERIVIASGNAIQPA
jgi:hypothetical protein